MCKQRIMVAFIKAALKRKNHILLFLIAFSALTMNQILPLITSNTSAEVQPIAPLEFYYEKDNQPLFQTESH